MIRLPEKTLPEALALLADLGEHLGRAQQLVQGLPLPQGPPGWEAELPRVFATAQDAVESFAELVSGLHLSGEGAPPIALRHSGRGVTVFVDAALTGAPGHQAIAAFIDELRVADARLLRLAELLGLLLGLAARWAASGFAPPVVLAALRQAAPRILELGRPAPPVPVT